ncbi:hypothetical protein BVX93_00660 [bacterium B13(2017)]|nr:hypothetical protein BVX93_00660 [bacterium B13(2017)]
MIRHYFGINKNPFDFENVELLPHQEKVVEILNAHAHIGGLSTIIGEPGTGKTVIKKTMQNKTKQDKRYTVACVGRTLHTYRNTIQILCDAFEIEPEHSSYKSERKLINEAYELYRAGKFLITIIDEAHLMEIDTLRRLRLMFDDFPKNHNLILIGLPSLMQKLSLKVNDDIKSRVTYSEALQKLNPDDMEKFIYSQLEKAGLGHHVFSPESIELIVRYSEGVIRRARNLSLSSMIQAVRAQTKEVNTQIVNEVLRQPHWRKEYDMEEI